MRRWLLGAMLVAGCATSSQGPGVGPAPRASATAEKAPRVRVEVPSEAWADLGEGLVRTLHVEIYNAGPSPIGLVAIEARGLGEATRRLAVSESGAERSLSYVPPGRSARHAVGLHFPRPGHGEVALVVRFRPLPPKTPGRLMEPVPLPAAPDHQIQRAFQVQVAPRGFGLEAAAARTGGPADEALYSPTLEAWVVRRGNEAWVVEVGQTRTFPGLSLDAVRVLDAYSDAVPVLDAGGRWNEVPKGPMLDRVLEEARRRGWRVRAVSYGEGGRGILVEP